MVLDCVRIDTMLATTTLITKGLSACTLAFTTDAFATASALGCIELQPVLKSDVHVRYPAGWMIFISGFNIV